MSNGHPLKLTYTYHPTFRLEAKQLKSICSSSSRPPNTLMTIGRIRSRKTNQHSSRKTVPRTHVVSSHPFGKYYLLKALSRPAMVRQHRETSIMQSAKVAYICFYFGPQIIPRSAHKVKLLAVHNPQLHHRANGDQQSNENQ